MSTRIRLCGRLEVELAGERVEQRLPGRQGPLVLALLALNRDRPVGRDELIGALWPADAPADPDEALSALLSKVRQAVGRQMLTGRRELTLALPEDAEIDVEQAFAALERAEGTQAGGQPRATWEAASQAAEIAGQTFLVGHDAAWVEDRRRELEDLCVRALELVAQAGIELGGTRLGGAERAAREIIASAPLREAGHRLLMETLAARGEVAEALAAYETMRVLLRDELGMTPGTATRALHERLLTGGAPELPSSPARDVKRVLLPAPLAPRDDSAFVGREPELERLRTAWADARAGRRRLALLSGGPGIGKTRLASELAREAYTEGTVLYGDCKEDALVSYQPFVEALRHYLRSDPLEDTAGRLGPGAAELAHLIPELVPHAGAGDDSASDDPETRRYLMFDAVSSLLTEASLRAPLLLVLDDLHWADRSTLRLLGHVVRAHEDASLLVLATYRETDVAADHPLLQLLADVRHDGPFERVSLGGLDRSAVDALIASHAGQHASSALVETLHAETAGNPFFVEEMVRHLIESGVVFDRERRWGSTPLPEQIGVPEGVKEVLTLRLNRLSENCRGILAHAAVLGRDFPFDLLPAMSGLGEEAVIDGLEEALGAHLVVEEQGHPESLYGFVHALVRETLYGSLSSPRRRRMHALAAGAIEAAHKPDDDARTAALALHYRLAGSAGDPAKAIQYSLRAGERARQLFAWNEAVAHWDGAVAMMEHTGAPPAERARLLVALAETCAVVGELGHQIAYLERALALYEELGDSERAAQVHSRLGMAHSLIDSIYAAHLDVERAFGHFDAARAVLERGPSRKALGHLETGVATALTYGLRIPAGIEAAARGMEIGERLGDEILWAGAAQAYGWHKLVAGDLQEGFAMTERAFEVADREQRPFLAFMGSNIRAQWTWGLGAPDEAQAYFERPLRLPYVGNIAYRQEIADGIGRCHLARGELDDARRLLGDASAAWFTHSLRPLLDLWDGRWDDLDALAAAVLATSRRTGNRWDEWAAHYLAGRIRFRRGELEQAVKSFEDGLAIVVDGGARYFELWVLPELARVRAENGQLEEARMHVERCQEIVGGGEDWRGRSGIAEVAEAVLLAFEERADDADARFASALARLRECRLVAEEADCVHQWGIALSKAGDASQAVEKLEAAAEIYRRHGTGAVWLERVERDARHLGARPRA